MKLFRFFLFLSIVLLASFVSRASFSESCEIKEMNHNFRGLDAHNQRNDIFNIEGVSIEVIGGKGGRKSYSESWISPIRIKAGSKTCLTEPEIFQYILYDSGGRYFYALYTNGREVTAEKFLLPECTHTSTKIIRGGGIIPIAILFKNRQPGAYALSGECDIFD